MKLKTILRAFVAAVLTLCLVVLIYTRTTDPNVVNGAPRVSAAEVTEEPSLEDMPVIESDYDPEIVVLPTEPTPAPTPTPDPYGDKPEIDISSWEYVLVNTDNLLSSDYVPEVTALENGQYFDSRAVDALRSFIQGARDAGLSVYLTSSYRSYATQQYLFNNKVAQYGSEEEAARIVAIPGSSEHQTGLAADIVDQYYQYMNESLADTELSKWMKAHCAEYGFILRFPEDKQDITGIMFEPWHFRYVGVEAATYIMEKGLCLEEFVALYS